MFSMFRPAGGLADRLCRAAAAACLVCSLSSAIPAEAALGVDESSKYYESALSYFNRGRFNEAVIQLKNALKIDPHNLPARVLIGRVHLMLSDGASAEKELVRARNSGGDEAFVLVPLGQAYLMQRKFDELLADIQSGGRSASLEARILDLRGQAYLGLLELAEAERVFSTSMRLRRGYASPMVGLARGLTKRGKWDESEQMFARALDTDPENVQAFYHRGELRRLRRQLGEAVRDYSQAIRLQPGHLPSRIGRAASLVALRFPERAIPDLDLVRRADPGDPLAAYYESKMLRGIGDDTGAETAIREAENIVRNLAPGFVQTYPLMMLTAGMVYFELRNYPEARRHLSAYIASDPYHPAARGMLGHTLLKQRDPEEAERVLEPATWLTPDDPELLATWGTALMRIGRHAQATEVLEKAVEISPDYTMARAQLGLSRLATGRRDDAVKEFASVLELDPEAVNAGIMLAIVHLKNGDFEEVLKVTGSLIAHGPDQAAPYNFAGAAHLGLGDRVAARASFERALEVDPGHRSALGNLARLDVREGRLEDAKARFQTMLEMFPGSSAPMLALAEIAESQGDLREAARWLERVRNSDRSAVAAHIRLALMYIALGEADNAAVLAREIREENGETPAVLEMYGRAELAAGNKTAARKAFFSLAELAKDTPEVMHRAAQLQLASGDQAGAHTTLKRVAVTFPKYIPAQVALIDLEGRLGLYERALERIEEVRAANPEFQHLDRLKGDALMRARRFEEAAASFSKALERGESSELLLRHYLTLREQGKEPPLERLEKWLAENPQDYNVRKVLAGAYMDRDQWDQAAAAHEALLLTAPDDAQVINNLAWIYHQQGDLRAVGFAERAYALAPNRASVLDTLGWILVREGQVRRGLSLLREAQARQSEDPTISYHIAYALNRLGRTAQARKQLETLLSSGVEFREADEARALLERLLGS